MIYGEMFIFLVLMLFYFIDLEKYQEAAGIELETVPTNFHDMQIA